MRFKPLNDRIIIKRYKDEYVDDNPEVARIAREGIIKLPDTSETLLKKRASYGEIISWGDKCRYKDQYKVGQKIAFAQFAFTKFEGFEDDIIAIKEDDLHGFVFND